MSKRASQKKIDPIVADLVNELFKKLTIQPTTEAPVATPSRRTRSSVKKTQVEAQPPTTEAPPPPRTRTRSTKAPMPSSSETLPEVPVPSTEAPGAIKAPRASRSKPPTTEAPEAIKAPRASRSKAPPKEKPHVIVKDCETLREEIPISYEKIKKMEKPKAIFIGGGPGSGKTYLINKLFSPEDFEKCAMYNVDLYQEYLLKLNGLYGSKEKEIAIYTEIKAENPDLPEEELKKLTKSKIASITSTTLNASLKCMREDFTKMIANKMPIIIDRPGDSSTTVLKDKAELKTAGYETMMIMVYVSPLTAFKRNNERERKVHPASVLRAWVGCMENIKEYIKEKAFGKENFFVIQNDDSVPFQNLDKDIIEIKKQIYVDPETERKIKALTGKDIEFSNIRDVKDKIKTFLNPDQEGGKRKANISSRQVKRPRIKK